MITRRLNGGAPSGWRGNGCKGYATSIVVTPEQRGPTRRPRTSVVGVLSSASTKIQTSASAGVSRRTSARTSRSLFIVSHDQHRVPIAEETIFLLHGCLIRLPR